MKTNPIITLAALLLLCCTLFTCKPEDMFGTIYGTVTDFATGELVPNANVQLRPSGETMLTGTDGVYEFSDIPVGDYSITVSKAGYTNLIDDYVITVRGGVKTRRDVQIKSKINGDVVELSGVFSVEPTTYVYFAPGNLQYQASTNTWRFANHQYDVVGSTSNANISPTYDGWIDLFGWGTGDNPTQIWSSDDQDFSTFIDWGSNTISNTTNTWRTLTSTEWAYVFENRYTESGIRYAKARVNNVNGVLLLPDD